MNIKIFLQQELKYSIVIIKYTFYVLLTAIYILSKAYYYVFKKSYEEKEDLMILLSK